MVINIINIFVIDNLLIFSKFNKSLRHFHELSNVRNSPILDLIFLDTNKDEILLLIFQRVLLGNLFKISIFKILLLLSSSFFGSNVSKILKSKSPNFLIIFSIISLAKISSNSSANSPFQKPPILF